MRPILLLLCITLAFAANAQKIFIPYRTANKWGLADTSGKVVLTPQFDTLYYDEFANYTNKSIYFIAETNKRKGVIADNKVVLPPSYNLIAINRHYFFAMNGSDADRRISLHDMRGKLLNVQPYKNAEQVYHNFNNYEQVMLAVKLADHKYNLIYIDTTGKLVTLLQNQYSIASANNLVEVVKKEGAAREYYTVQRSPKGLLSLAVQQPPSAQGTDGVMQYDVAVPPADYAGSGGSTSYRFTKTGNEWKSYSNYAANNIDFRWNLYDTVLPFNTDYNHLHNKDDKGRYLQYENALLTRKNGLYGLVLPDGKVIANDYDEIKFFRTSPGNYFLRYVDSTLLLVKKNGKYGIIGLDEKALIPLACDQLDANMIARAGNKWGVLQTDGSWLLQPVYDQIDFVQWKAVYELTKDKKYGLYWLSTDVNVRVLMDCISPYPLKGWKRFRTNAPAYFPYHVYEAYDANGRFLGYYDRKGFAYFK